MSAVQFSPVYYIIFLSVQTLMYSMSQFPLLTRQRGPLKYWYESAKLHGVMSQRMYVMMEEVCVWPQAQF
jgi:hypothetical protein